jgi:hypothetical protein
MQINRPEKSRNEKMKVKGDEKVDHEEEEAIRRQIDHKLSSLDVNRQIRHEGNSQGGE